MKMYSSMQKIFYIFCCLVSLEARCKKMKQLVWEIDKLHTATYWSEWMDFSANSYNAVVHGKLRKSKGVHLYQSMKTCKISDDAFLLHIFLFASIQRKNVAFENFQALGELVLTLCYLKELVSHCHVLKRSNNPLNTAN